MEPIDYIYVALAAAFLLVMIYMFTYNTKMRRREDALKSSSSKWIGKQEAIAMTIRGNEQVTTPNLQVRESEILDASKQEAREHANAKGSQNHQG